MDAERTVTAEKSCIPAYSIATAIDVGGQCCSRLIPMKGACLAGLTFRSLSKMRRVGSAYLNGAADYGGEWKHRNVWREWNVLDRIQVLHQVMNRRMGLNEQESVGD